MPKPLVFTIRGMDCAEEVAVLKREVGPVVGGADRLGFDLLNGKMTVAIQEPAVSAAAIVAAVAQAGLSAELWKGDAKSVGPQNQLSWQPRTILTMASGLLGLLGFLVHIWWEGGVQAALGSEGLGLAARVPWPVITLYVAGIIGGVWLVLPKAWLSLKRVRPDMNLLMTIAVVGAAVIGEWFEAATVAFLFSLSLTIESWSVGRARRAVEALLDLAAPQARLLQPDGAEQSVAPEEVPVGATVLVKPGERIPLDGVVLKGTSQVNQAPITGESMPVPKKLNDGVFAGTVNGDGALEIKTTKPAGDTTLAHIIRMVGQAQSKRASSEQWVEKFAAIYTPVILALAITIVLGPPLLFQQSWQEWFYRALVLLVIACPCALVISTPVSIVAGLASAARNGVLIKGGMHLESPARLRAIAFDKTGTLTEGKPQVVEIVPLNNHTEAELLERAAALEARSEHPLAKAIVAFAKERGIVARPAEDFQIIQGKGASAQFNGKPFWLGSHRYLEERGQETPEVHERLEVMSQAGRSVVVIGNDSHVCGLITVADTVRPGAKAALNALRQAGIQSMVMLTGDNQATANAIGKETGVDEVRAELLPADKVAAVEELVSRHGQVAMVGDGINDAPALAQATLGIAMGAAGSDAAIETADIALMSDDLSKLPWLIHHSRRTQRIVRQNIVFALVVKATFALLTFVGYAHLWAAIAADMGASLLVIFNGLRLLRAANLETLSGK